MLKNVGAVSWKIFDLSKYGRMTLFIQSKNAYKQKKPKQDQEPQTNPLTAFFFLLFKTEQLKPVTYTNVTCEDFG